MNEFKSFYKSVKGNEGERCHYSTRLDTYGCGCQHNCMYCYAKSLLDFRKLWNPAEPSVADIEKIKRVIKRIPQGSIIRLGGMTDCFQPMEKEYRVTYETIKALNDANIGYLIVTKSDLVASEEYLQLMRKDLAHIQVSITSTDESISRRIEPGASLPEQRIKAVETLQERGFDVQVRLSPFIPEFVDIARINSIKCDKILVEFLRINSFINKWLTNTSKVDLSQYTLNSAGYKHLPLERKINLIGQLKFPQISVCEDVAEHWEYWTKNVNHNSNDCCNLK